MQVFYRFTIFFFPKLWTYQIDLSLNVTYQVFVSIQLNRIEIQNEL